MRSSASYCGRGRRERAAARSQGSDLRGGQRVFRFPWAAGQVVDGDAVPGQAAGEPAGEHPAGDSYSADDRLPRPLITGRYFYDLPPAADQDVRRRAGSLRGGGRRVAGRRRSWRRRRCGRRGPACAGCDGHHRDSEHAGQRGGLTPAVTAVRPAPARPVSQNRQERRHSAASCEGSCHERGPGGGRWW